MHLLGSEHTFPSAETASREGIVAIGGDLDPNRILNAYKKGIFPWFENDNNLVWWSPDPRMVLFPKKIKISKSTKKIINQNLTSKQKEIMFNEGTERPFTSELLQEKRKGFYHCANCGIKLFDSKTIYESGSGWPSFYQSLPDVFETKTDYLLGYARTEYHCKNCGGHHGHIFEDGPKPTGKRYCNNGVCLVFKPSEK